MTLLSVAGISIPACDSSGSAENCEACQKDADCESGYCTGAVCANEVVRTECCTPIGEHSEVCTYIYGRTTPEPGCETVADLEGCPGGGSGYCWKGECLPWTSCLGRADRTQCGSSDHYCFGEECVLAPCTKKEDGAYCEGAFLDCSHDAYCVREECLPAEQFVVLIWGLEEMPCADVDANYARYNYAISLADEAVCPDGEECRTIPLTSFQGKETDRECVDGHYTDYCRGCAAPDGLGYCITPNDFKTTPGAHGGWKYCPDACTP